MESKTKSKCSNCDDTGYFVRFPWPNCEECEKGRNLNCWSCGKEKCNRKHESDIH